MLVEALAIEAFADGASAGGLGIADCRGRRLSDTSSLTHTSMI
jgi:hypothetical protein